MIFYLPKVTLVENVFIPLKVQTEKLVCTVLYKELFLHEKSVWKVSVLGDKGYLVPNQISDQVLQAQKRFPPSTTLFA